MEVMSQLEIACQIGYIAQIDLHNIELQVVQIARLLTSLQYSYMPKDSDGDPIKPYKPINS